MKFNFQPPSTFIVLDENSGFGLNRFQYQGIYRDTVRETRYRVHYRVEKDVATSYAFIEIWTPGGWVEVFRLFITNDMVHEKEFPWTGHEHSEIKTILQSLTERLVNTASEVVAR